MVFGDWKYRSKSTLQTLPKNHWKCTSIRLEFSNSFSLLEGFVLLLYVFLYVLLKSFKLIVCSFHHFSDFFCVKLLFIQENLEIELIASLSDFGFMNFLECGFVGISSGGSDMELLYNMFFLHKVLNFIAKILVALVALTLKSLDS